MEKMTLLFCSIFVCLLFPHAITAECGTLTSNNDAISKRNFITLGNKWHVYLRTITYDIARTVVYETSTPVGLHVRQAPQTISELTKAIPRTIHNTYPCQTLLIIEAE